MEGNYDNSSKTKEISEEGGVNNTLKTLLKFDSKTLQDLMRCVHSKNPDVGSGYTIKLTPILRREDYFSKGDSLYEKLLSFQINSGDGGATQNFKVSLALRLAKPGSKEEYNDIKVSNDTKRYSIVGMFNNEKVINECPCVTVVAVVILKCCIFQSNHCGLIFNELKKTELVRCNVKNCMFGCCNNKKCLKESNEYTCKLHSNKNM
jgi:hypothetical protein